MLTTCTVTDAANSIHVHTVGLVTFCSSYLCRFLVDSADIWKHHNLGNLVVVLAEVQGRKAIAQFMSMG